MVKIQIIFNKKNKEIYLNPKKWKDVIFFIMMSEKSEEMGIKTVLMKNILDSIKNGDMNSYSLNMSKFDLFDSRATSVHQNNIEDFLLVLTKMDANAKKFLQNTDIPKLISEMQEFVKELQDQEILLNYLNKIEQMEE